MYQQNMSILYSSPHFSLSSILNPPWISFSKVRWDTWISNCQASWQQVPKTDSDVYKEGGQRGAESKRQKWDFDDKKSWCIWHDGRLNLYAGRHFSEGTAESTLLSCSMEC